MIHDVRLGTVVLMIVASRNFGYPALVLSLFIRINTNIKKRSRNHERSVSGTLCIFGFSFSGQIAGLSERGWLMLYMSGGKLATVKLIQKYSVTVRYSLYDVGTQRSTKVIYSFHNLLFRNFQVVYDILNDNRKSAWWSTCEFKLLYLCSKQKVLASNKS